MSQELKELLRSVLKEELQPIYEQLNRFERIQEQIEEMRAGKYHETFIHAELIGFKQFVDLSLKQLQHKTDAMIDKLLKHEKEIIGLKFKASE
ncbi:hypothetical protein [Anoxybacillus sp. J5B_2022]|uniref:hypothetical protein n=1 Tax=Anoxybacillus sp. J5B_2022 TaxID=3003246 RepID=UPI002285D630|nr:hypothetical protein [Anoxybacillus sp. J5B_2022]MCZ0753992.1 hypothetical protein [Anoxybacillus sp. J5B_2022]